MSFLDSLSNYNENMDVSSLNDFKKHNDYINESALLDINVINTMISCQKSANRKRYGSLLENGENESNNTVKNMQEKMTDVWKSFYVNTKESIASSYNYIYESSFNKYEFVKNKNKLIRSNIVMDTKGYTAIKPNEIVIKPKSKSTYDAILRCDKKLIFNMKTVNSMMKLNGKINTNALLGAKRKYTYVEDINKIKNNLIKYMERIYMSGKDAQSSVLSMLDKYNSVVMKLISKNKLNDAMDKKNEMMKVVSIYDTYSKAIVIAVTEIYTILRAYTLNDKGDDNDDI